MKKRFLLAIIISLLAAVSLPVVSSARAAVTLTYFIADADSPTDSIYLEWETATELDNVGFYVTRSTNQTGPFVRITNFIPARGDGVTGAMYFFYDLTVQNLVRYWYRLETINTNNQSEFYGPVTAQLGGPTATTTPTGPTLTPTITLTPSRTPTLPPGVTPSDTPTGTITPTSTQTTFIQRTPTPRPSSTLIALDTTPTNLPGTTATDIPTPTETLDVAPIELMFPAPTQPVKVVTMVVITEVAPGSIIIEQAPVAVRGQLNLMIGLVIVLWLVLAVFLVLFIRKLAL